MNKYIGLLLIAIALSPPNLSAQSRFDCMASAPHRQFDFWLGNWEVHDPNGVLQGHNAITVTQKGCALEEHWQGIKGSQGQSINYFHPDQGQWLQLWHDAGAGIIDIRGGLQGVSMVLEGSIYYPGTRTEKPFKGSWTPLPDGRVRQHFEEQDDQGEWQTWFDGFYTPVPAPE
jgi:hypothetical protein